LWKKRGRSKDLYVLFSVQLQGASCNIESKNGNGNINGTLYPFLLTKATKYDFNIGFMMLLFSSSFYSFNERYISFCNKET
jgi:hypothetical protein